MGVLVFVGVFVDVEVGVLVVVLVGVGVFVGVFVGVLVGVFVGVVGQTTVMEMLLLFTGPPPDQVATPLSVTTWQ